MRLKRKHVQGPRTGVTWCGLDIDGPNGEELVRLKLGSFNWEEVDICGNCYNRCNQMHAREAKRLGLDT